MNKIRYATSIKILLVGSLLCGLTLVLDPFIELNVNPALYNAGPKQEALVGIFISIGSILLLTKTLHWKNMSTEWRLELTGLPIFGTGWALYTVVIFLVAPTAIFPIILGTTITMSTVYRFFFVNYYVLQTRYHSKKVTYE